MKVWDTDIQIYILVAKYINRIYEWERYLYIYNRMLFYNNFEYIVVKDLNFFISDK